MTRTLGTVARAGVLALSLGMLCACASPPADAWQLTPLRYDNRMDGAIAAQLTDVTYPMSLTADTAGGLWGYSAGSWLHLDAEGETLRRFNLLDGEAPSDIRGVAALSPELLVVSAPAPGASGALHLFDTAAGSWEVLHVADDILADGILGDVATHDGSVYVVALATGDGVFTVRRFDPEAPAAPVDVTPPLPLPPALTPSLHGTVAIAVGPDGSIHVATQAERIVVDADGTIRERDGHETWQPEVAVGPDGTAVWATGSAGTEASAPVHVVGGSAEARAVLTGAQGCDDDHVLVGRGIGNTAVPLPCGARGLAWVGPETIVASTGGESGAVLVRLDPPR